MFQKMIVVGNLGSDPEMRYMSDGRVVTNFSLACNRKWNGGEETTWFRVAVWGNQAEACNQWLAKGRRVLVEGRLNPDPQTGGPRTFVRHDGSVGASFEITAQSVQFLGGNADSSGAAPTEDEEIPF